MAFIPNVKLNNGVMMPELGLGVAGLGNGETFYKAIDSALDIGYRMFDTAPFYDNEAETGDALRNCGIAREELFITTKLPNACHAYDDTVKAIDKALVNMGFDYIDLFLIHFPCPGIGKYHEAWAAMEKMQEEGKVRCIGVSNFQEEHIEKILSTGHVVPQVNEIECNPYLTVRPLCNYCTDKGIRLINWFPLGGPNEPLVPYPEENFKILVEDPVLVKIGEKYGKTAAQVSLRWATQNNITPIPKSSNPDRLRLNADIFDFELTKEELEEIDALNYDRRFGPDPKTFNDPTMG